MEFKEFKDLMMEFKENIHKGLESSITTNSIENIRNKSEGKYNKEKFRELFINKVTIHIIYKYVFIRMSSEFNNFISDKFNAEGIRKWNEMSKNYRNDYYELFKYSCDDIRRSSEIRDIFGEIFDESIYDKYIEKIKRNVFNDDNNYIKKLKDYNFSNLSKDNAVSLFDALYTSVEKEKLQQFLEDSKVTTALMEALGLI